MLLTVVYELNVVQYLLYLRQQSFYGNFSDAASPELRDVSAVQQKTAWRCPCAHCTVLTLCESRADLYVCCRMS